MNTNNEPDIWEVVRWSGRQTDCWTLKYDGFDEQKAREVFAQELERMRQGAIELRRGKTATVVKRSFAPTLRRYW